MDWRWTGSKLLCESMMTKLSDKIWYDSGLLSASTVICTCINEINRVDKHNALKVTCLKFALKIPIEKLHRWTSWLNLPVSLCLASQWFNDWYWLHCLFTVEHGLVSCEILIGSHPVMSLSNLIGCVKHIWISKSCQFMQIIACCLWL